MGGRIGHKEAQEDPKREPMDMFQLCDVVREAGFAAHRFLRNGHLEKIYENSLVNRLRKAGLSVCQQHPLQVFDEDGGLLGDFFTDLFVDGRLIVELKAVRSLADEHTAQLLGYLRASRVEHGLLINFGAPKYQIRKFILNDAIQGNHRGLDL
jgi:GxxExxY protein